MWTFPPALRNGCVLTATTYSLSVLGVAQGNFSQMYFQFFPSTPRLPIYCPTKQLGSWWSDHKSQRCLLSAVGAGGERGYQFLKSHAFQVSVTNKSVFYLSLPSTHTHQLPKRTRCSGWRPVHWAATRGHCRAAQSPAEARRVSCASVSAKPPTCHRKYFCFALEWSYKT